MPSFISELNPVFCCRSLILELWHIFEGFINYHALYYDFIVHSDDETGKFVRQIWIYKTTVSD